MARRGRIVTRIVPFAFTVACLAYGPVMAASFLGELPASYSDSTFHIGADTSSLMININAIGARDPSICPSCNSAYTDNFTVKLFNQAGALLESVNETNYLYYSLYSSSHGIGAAPVALTVPAGGTTLEITSSLYISGLLGVDGHPLSFGNLYVYTDGSAVSSTPIPGTLPLLATGLVVLGLITFYRRRKAGNGFVAA